MVPGIFCHIPEQVGGAHQVHGLFHGLLGLCQQSGHFLLLGGLDGLPGFCQDGGCCFLLLGIAAGGVYLGQLQQRIALAAAKAASSAFRWASSAAFRSSSASSAAFWALARYSTISAFIWTISL